MKRKASAEWQGDLKSGKGTVSSESGVLAGTPYSFSTRFESVRGTNPEELIAAAHAGCYSMQLSAMLANGGKNPTSVSTTAHVTLAMVDDKPTITEIVLDTVGIVPGLSSEEFAQFAQDAKAACLITRALAGVENVTLTARLED